MFNGIFYGAEHVFVHHIASVTDDEEVAEFLVEDDFGRHAAVGTAQHCGKRLLPRAKLLSQYRIIVFWRQGSYNEAFIAIFEGL